MSGMTCREFNGVVHGFVRMELLDVTLREAALDHVARCADCGELMAEATALAEATMAAGSNAYGLQAPANVEIAVLAAFRKHHRRAVWRRTFQWAAIGAVAAMVMVFVWTFAGPSKGRLSSVPGKTISSQSKEPLDAKGPASPAMDELTQPAEVEVADSSSSLMYAASDFVPVPFTEGISADDPGMVVRVQLTRASLAQLGYPVAETPDEDLIRADVLVGEDGWPRGVKLVQ